MEERFAQIERDNRILLEKMSNIIRGGGGIDNRNTNLHYQTSNRHHRKRELEKITRENLAILRRIQDAKGDLDHADWEAHGRKHDELVKNISEMPIQRN